MPSYFLLTGSFSQGQAKCTQWHFARPDALGAVRGDVLVSYTMPPEMAKQAEHLARKEHRTMSELTREALRRYEQASAILNLREYIRQIAPTPPALRAMQECAKRKGTDRLSMAQIDSEVAAVRRQHSGKKKAKQRKR